MKTGYAEISPDSIQERLTQAEEMSQIWDKSPEAVQMYLKGCMATAAALAGQQCEPRKAG
ncbi:hypothetical protein DS742_05310 [Lacrimispora amygdalina]|uniref:Uncharacterized protein n=1 Tax=Lacrimispora amygdalina TaxID=253257 RepID=A0A3E2NG58_9FIRM|nr:hypothetical protein [Clostridium indicum]RFZ79880.1 hypothetical protein DS742_05310 [Clostridium indicum]